MKKKIAAVIAALIFAVNSPAVYAENIVIERTSPGQTRQTFPQNVYDEENFNRNAPEVDAPFQKPERPSQSVSEPEENSPAVNSPFQQPEMPERPSQSVSEPVNSEEPPVNEYEKQTPPEISGEGLEFLVYDQDGVMAFAVIAAHENYKILPFLAQGQIKGLATVSQMNPPNAIASINASYFSPGGLLYGITKIDGMTAATGEFVRSGIGINSDGSVVFGKVRYLGTLTAGGESLPIAGVNIPRETNSVMIYNKLYGETTDTNDFGTEFVVQNGVVTSIFVNRGNSYIPPNGYIVSVHGTAAERLINVQPGDRVSLEENFINVDDTGDFNIPDYVICAGPRLVKSGEIFVTSGEEKFPADIGTGRAPRSAFGVTQYGDYIFAVVDGRQEHSKGCTLEEWAAILKNHFGAVDAINLDGGGSTELIVKGNMVNIPSDGHERKVGDIISILPK